MTRWSFTLRLPIIALGLNPNDLWVEDIKKSLLCDLTLKDDEQIIELRDVHLLNDSFVQFYNIVSGEVKVVIDEQLQRTYQYLSGLGDSQEAIGRAILNLQDQDSFVIPECTWREWHQRPLESDDKYYQRLVTFIPLHYVLNRLCEVSLYNDITYEALPTLYYEDINFEPRMYLQALKHRERRRIEPLVRRILVRTAKIRELHRANTTDIIENNLLDCK